jgi:hypothetical protein
MAAFAHPKVLVLSLLVGWHSTTAMMFCGEGARGRNTAEMKPSPSYSIESSRLATRAVSEMKTGLAIIPAVGRVLKMLRRKMRRAVSRAPINDVFEAKMGSSSAS